MLLAALMVAPALLVACGPDELQKQEITITIPGTAQVEVAKLYGLWFNEADEEAPSISFLTMEYMRKNSQPTMSEPETTL